MPWDERIRGILRVRLFQQRCVRSCGTPKPERPPFQTRSLSQRSLRARGISPRASFRWRPRRGTVRQAP